MFVSSEPTTGAEISLGGRKLAVKTNTLVKRLKPGRYDLKLVRAGANSSELPSFGEAAVNVVAGQTARVTIGLNKMAIVPAAGTTQKGPQTPGQKAILDYYSALNAQDLQKAFAYLTRRAKTAQGGFGRFSQTWRRVVSVTVRGIKKIGEEPQQFMETNQVELELRMAPPVRRRSTETTSTTPTELRSFTVTTFDELRGAGVPKIDAIAP